ncbi:aldo/keto reductase [Amedibacillus sp. YH-ame10]
MEFRVLNENYKPSLLGFGCMRFPLDQDGKIDEVEAERMLDHAIVNGVNYIDTAFPYHGGDSEPFVGRVLKKYERSSYYLTTKMPLWNVETLEEAKAMFENQLKRLDVDYVDFYLLHAMDKEKWEKAKALGVVTYCEELKAQGKIRNLGFSFHDEYEVFEEMLTYRTWDFCQIQYNYIDTDIQAGDKGYELTEKMGVPVIIMEPIKGGSLSFLPEDVACKFTDYAPDKSISSWALRWVGSKPNVKVILSGMSTFAQVEDNLRTFDQFQPLHAEEEMLVKEVAKTIKERTMNGCTGCEYCMPCPFGVQIPKNFKLWNEYSKYRNQPATHKAYFDTMQEQERAANCQQCGKCETLCPQQIHIREDLKQMHQDMITKVK